MMTYSFNPKPQAPAPAPLQIALAVALASASLFLAPHRAARAGEPPAANAAAADTVSYRQVIRPLLKRHCWGCHAGGDPQGGLKLDAVADMLTGGDSGPLFVPGKPDESLLLKMISGDPPDMPKQQPPLSPAKVELLKRWVLAGGVDDSLPDDVAPGVKIPATYRFPAAISSVAFSPDARLVAAACRSEVVLVDAEGEAAPRRWPTECDLLSHVEFSPDGSLLAAVGGSPGQYGEVRFFKTADGSVASVRRIGHDTLFRGAFSPDGAALAVGGPDGAIHIVPVDLVQEIRRFELHSDWVLDVAYTPDGKTLISGGRDKATKVCSVETGKLIRGLDASPEPISSVASDDQFAVSAGRARTLTGFEYKTALAGLDAAGNGTPTPRDQFARPFEGPPQAVLDLATSADRNRLAVAGAFAEIRVYTTADRQRVATIANVPAPIYSVALNADGSRLVAGTKSGQVQIYSLPDGKLLKSLVPVPVEAAPPAAVAGNP